MKFFFCILSCLLYQPQLIEGQNTFYKLDGSSEPRFINFTPTSFSNKFSLNVTPVLSIRSGDTINTETIDAFGRDKKGVKRQGGGNPLTGPFYIEDSKPGDVLQITLTKVSLNRNYAYTTETFVSRSMPDSISKQFKKHIL